ncbi:hypothetical protein H6786_05710 [Candidatus Nomurabacteria bacterium]|nr:hypothetical protein [Candidatus Nomurabacteria bacterium]
MNSKEVKVEFSEVRDQIIDHLSQIQNTNINEPVSLVDGFFYNNFTQTWTNKTVLGGNTVVSIMLVGNNTGQIYHFPLKKFFPNFPDID